MRLEIIWLEIIWLDIMWFGIRRREIMRLGITLLRIIWELSRLCWGLLKLSWQVSWLWLARLGWPGWHSWPEPGLGRMIWRHLGGLG